MLTIREEQMRAFSEVMRRNFERRMCDNLLKYCPHVYASFGELRVRELVHHGVDKAFAHGIRSERHVASFLACVFALGEGFDASADYPWAAELLSDPDLSEAEKVDKLTTLAREQLPD